jgi:polyphenol oxidase
MIALRSALLHEAGFPHGFSLRTGGVSEGAYRSLNLGRSVGDDPERVAENHLIFARAIAFAPGRLFEASQVHGRAVISIDRASDVAATRKVEADALVTRAKGAALGVRTADCVPILIADPKSGAVAAVHAGWRGVVQRVLDAALDALDADPKSLIAAIGPHIRADQFEVSDEVAAQIARESHGAPVVLPREPRPHVDLALAIRAQLEARGVEAIDDVGGCTVGEPDRFFSHRRDQGITGRHLAVIAAR